MNKKQNPVVHFEMGYRDSDRVKKFYSNVFGWNMISMGEQMGGYVMAQTAETDDKGMLKMPGAINGGFYNAKDRTGEEAPSVVIAVDDIKQAMQDVVSAGGKILGAEGPSGRTNEPVMIPGVGLWISISDPEGNRVSMLQPAR